MSWVIASVVRLLKAERNDLQCSLWMCIEAFKDCCRYLFSAVGILLRYLFHFLMLGSKGLSLPLVAFQTTCLFYYLTYILLCLMGIRIELIPFKSIFIDYLGVVCAWFTEEKCERHCWWFLLISASIKWEMAQQLGRCEERKTVSQVYLHWGDVANAFVGDVGAVMIQKWI